MEQYIPSFKFEVAVYCAPSSGKIIFVVSVPGAGLKFVGPKINGILRAMSAIFPILAKVEEPVVHGKN